MPHHSHRTVEAVQQLQPRSGRRWQTGNLEPKKDIVRQRRHLNYICQFRMPRQGLELEGEVLIFRCIALKTVHRHLRGYDPYDRDTIAAFLAAYVHTSRARAVGGRLRSSC